MLTRCAVLGTALITCFAGQALPAEKSQVILKIEGLRETQQAQVTDVLTKRVEFLLGRNTEVEIKGEDITVSFEDSADPQAAAQALAKRGSISVMQVPFKFTVIPDPEGKLIFMQGRLSPGESGGTLTYSNMEEVTIQRVVAESRTLFTEADLLRRAAAYLDPPAVTDDPEKWWHVAIEFTPQATKKFADMTAKGLGQTIVVLLDGELAYGGRIVAPVGDGRLSLGFGKAGTMAKAFAAVVQSGPLPKKPKLVVSRLGKAVEPARAPAPAAPPFCAQSHFYREYSWAQDGAVMLRVVPQAGWAKAEVPTGFPPTKLVRFSFDDVSESVILEDGFANASPIGSSDAKTIAYLSYRDDTSGDKKLDDRDAFAIAVLRGEGSAPDLVVPAKKGARTFLMSPNARHLAYTAVTKDTDGDGMIGPLDRGSVSILDLGSKSEVKVSSEADDDWVLAFAPDSTGFLIARFGSDTNKDGKRNKADTPAVLLVKPDGTATRVAGDSRACEFVSFSGDGKSILAFCAPKATGGWDLMQLSLDGKSQKTLISGARNPEVLAFSSDFGKAACVLDSEGEGPSRVLCIADLGDGQVKTLGATDKTDFAGAAFSRDGAKLVVCAAGDTNQDGKADAKDNHQIAVYDTATGAKTVAADDSAYNRPAEFADGGRAVVFRRITEDSDFDGLLTPGDRGTLVKVAIDSKEETILAKADDDPSLFSASPDGKKLMISVRQPDSDEIRFRVIDLQGTVLKVLQGRGF
jgi:Tol biopolymer transport system component